MSIRWQGECASGHGIVTYHGVKLAPARHVSQRAARARIKPNKLVCVSHIGEVEVGQVMLLMLRLDILVPGSNESSAGNLSAILPRLMSDGRALVPLGLSKRLGPQLLEDEAVSRGQR